MDTDNGGSLNRKTLRNLDVTPKMATGDRPMIELSRRCVIALLICAAAGRLRAQEPAAQESYQQWLAKRTEELESYQFALEGTPPEALTMEPRSLLNWSNPERGTAAGAVFLWTQGGQPAMIACAFGRGQWLKHEFHSLSDRPLIGERSGSRVHRFAPGIEWHELTGAPVPAASRPLRLTQMRRQVERFEVSIVALKMGKAEPAVMRLLSQPVYRSPETAEGDTALFLFVQGTDPEGVLTLQATADKKWRYALSRQTKAVVKAKLDDKQVLDLPIWKAEPDSAFFVVTPPEATAGM